MRAATGIGRASMAAVLVTAIVIDVTDLLRTKFSAAICLTFLLAFVFESLFRTFGQWLANQEENRPEQVLQDGLACRGPVPPPEPEAPDLAEPPLPEPPEPSADPPPKQKPDWEGLAKEPAYLRKYPTLRGDHAWPL
jgi:hypothetical protein